MALTNKQISGICKLFAKTFVSYKTDDERKSVLIDFEDTFGNVILNWKSMCGEQISRITDDLDVVSMYEQLISRHDGNKKVTYNVRLVVKEDFEQVRKLLNSSFDLCISKHDVPKFELFVNEGYSFVVQVEDEILGVLLANVQPDVSVPSVYINSFAVAEHARGNGIGKALLDRLKERIRDTGMFLIKLQTDRKLPAFEIYKHWGMQESELVQMKYYYM